MTFGQELVVLHTRPSMFGLGKFLVDAWSNVGVWTNNILLQFIVGRTHFGMSMKHCSFSPIKTLPLSRHHKWKEIIDFVGDQLLLKTPIELKNNSAGSCSTIRTDLLLNGSCAQWVEKVVRSCSNLNGKAALGIVVLALLVQVLFAILIMAFRSSATKSWKELKWDYAGSWTTVYTLHILYRLGDWRQVSKYWGFAR